MDRTIQIIQNHLALYGVLVNDEKVKEFWLSANTGQWLDLTNKPTRDKILLIFYAMQTDGEFILSNKI